LRRFPAAILLSHWEAQSYKDEQYTDLWDFCDLLAKRCGKIDEKDVPIDKKDVPIDQDLAQACVEVQNAISSKEQDKGTVMLSGYCGAAFQYSYGLSVFFPWANMKDAAGTSDLDAYKKLKFCGGTDWDRFLSAYLSNTQRSPRDAGRKQHLKYKNRRIFLNPSRLDQRPGIYTTLALTGKGNPPDDKGNPPDDKFGLSKMGYMKNPPTDWYPCDLIVEELLTKGMVIEKPAVDDDRPAK